MRGGGSYDLGLARIFAVLMLAVPALLAFFILRPGAAAEPGPATSSLAQVIEGINPKTLLGADDGRRFLPPPIAVLPAEVGAAPPAPAVSDQGAAGASKEKGKVANTGGAGAILRATPKGAQVAGLRDGQALDILDRQTVGEEEWLKIRTPQGQEGWIYGRLVSPG